MHCNHFQVVFFSGNGEQISWSPAATGSTELLLQPTSLLQGIHRGDGPSLGFRCQADRTASARN